MNRKIACIAFLALLSLPLLAFPADPFFRFAGGNGPVEAGLSFANDAFGPGPVVEWDDLYSYGFRLSLPLPSGLAFGMVYDGLTNRGVVAADATRVDALSACFAFNAFAGLLPSLDLRATVFLGFQALGDFGAIALQEGWHSGQGIQRPFPLGYDAGEGLLPLVGFDASLAAPWPLAPYGSADFEWTVASSWLGYASLGLAYNSGGSRLALAAGWVAGAASDQSPTLHSVMRRELGPAIAFSAKVGHFAFELQSIAGGSLSSGSLGLVLAPSAPGQSDTPFALRLSCGLALGEAAAPGMRLELIMPRPPLRLAGGFYVSLGNGWIGKDATGASAPRFSDYAAGVLVEAMGRGRRLSASAGLGLRLSLEGLYALSLERSSLLESRLMADLDLEGSLRFSLASSKDCPFGLGLKLRWTPLALEIVAAKTGFAGRPGLEVQAFVFSSNR